MPWFAFEPVWKSNKRDSKNGQEKIIKFKHMKEFWKECEPLKEIPEFQPTQEFLYKTWNKIKQNKLQ